ncbi:unnamed protein product [Arabidopsis halleri]
MRCCIWSTPPFERLHFFFFYKNYRLIRSAPVEMY